MATVLSSWPDLKPSASIHAVHSTKRMQRLTLDPTASKPPTRTHAYAAPAGLPPATRTHTKPSATSTGEEEGKKAEEQEEEKEASKASIFFVGTATTILTYAGLRILTDPNFLHAGDHVHLGPGVVATRRTDPALELHELPPIDLVLLSHYHEDHFDAEVEASLRRDLPIVTTAHARGCLVDGKEAGERFEKVLAVGEWESVLVDFVVGRDGTAARKEEKEEQKTRRPAVKVTGMPGKHVPDGLLSKLNELAGAVPPTNGWMVELGSVVGGGGAGSSGNGDNDDYDDDGNADHGFECGYRIYISGDTLMVEELKEIPKRYAGRNIDLMLVHLGGTTIPSPSLPLLMVTMDATQGLELVRLVNPDLTIPIHYDDYDVFLSPLSDFKKVMHEAGLSDKAIYLDRNDQFNFQVKRHIS